MQSDNINSLTRFLSSWTKNQKYFEMLRMMASLSRLFSENDTPYLDYRLTENLFCKYFNATNDARSCTAYDAHFTTLGIGIKTFTLHNNTSTEKIAEFNKLKPELDPLRGIELARRLGQYRNERMTVSNNAYGLSDALYHIVGRDNNSLKVFNLPYDFVKIDSIQDVKEKSASLHFNDGINEYNFNKSKSVLMKRFVVPSDHVVVPVEILADPLTLLDSLLTNKLSGMVKHQMVRGVDYVILPLYSVLTNTVPPKSGLNQWNADGRARDENEVYLPIPKKVNDKYPNYFPPRDKQFELILPTGATLLAKKCQEGGKALMSNPNSALGEWLLRKVMGIKPGVLVTMKDLEICGFDSVVVYNLHRINPTTNLPQYSIQFGDIDEDYKHFIES